MRFAGLDITVYSSDAKRSPGRLARQGSPVLRRSLFEAAKCAARPASPDYELYTSVRERLGGKRPALTVARKLALVATNPPLAARPGLGAGSMGQDRRG